MMNVREFINMIREDHKEDTTFYINAKNKNIETIPPGHFTHTEKLEEVMSEVGDLEVETFFIGRENPAKAFLFSDLFICLNVTDKVSRFEDNVSNEDAKSLKEIVEKGKDTCPLCAYLDYFIKNPVPKPEIKPPIETRFLDDKKDDEKLVDDLYKLVINEAPTVPIEFFTSEKCAKDIIKLILNNVKGR